jgi:hypothetical protein
VMSVGAGAAEAAAGKKRLANASATAARNERRIII